MRLEHGQRRKYPRRSFKKAVSLIFDGNPRVAKGVEIGEGGISFFLEEKLSTPKKVIINFFISERDFFSVRISLVNAYKQGEGYTYGGSFDDVSIALKRQIRAYVAKAA